MGLSSNALMVDATLLPERWESLDIRKEKPLVPMAGAGVWWILAAAGVLGLVAAGWWTARRRPRAVARPARTRPAHETALEELERLRLEALPAGGRFTEFYVHLSAIIRRYVEARFLLRAPEMTTEEFLLATLNGQQLSSEHRALLQEFLSRCDLVKFAQYEPSEREAQHAFSSAVAFVQDTRPLEPRGQTPDGV